MRVKELVDLLQQVNPDYEVFVDGLEDGAHEPHVRKIEIAVDANIDKDGERLGVHSVLPPIGDFKYEAAREKHEGRGVPITVAILVSRYDEDEA